MRILVTGGAGFIGSHVAELMLERQHEVMVVDNLSSGHRRNLPSAAIFKQMDICDSALESLVVDFRPKAIFHLAAQIDVRKSVADPGRDASINVLGTVRLLQAATKADTKRVIFSSTGGAIYGEQDFFPATEAHPCRPVSPYGTSKLCAEAYLGYFQRAGGPGCLALRYSNVYGPRQDPHGEAGVVAIFTSKMLKGQPPVIFGDGKQTRDYVYVKDVARANLLALESSFNGVVNIGTGIETDVNTLAALLARHTRFSGQSIYNPPRPGEQFRSVIDPSMAKRELGFEPTIDLSVGLRETVEYFRANPNLVQ
jgi:UDP-glucose 4-epimerase